METDHTGIREVVLSGRARRLAAVLPLPVGVVLLGCGAGALALLRGLTIAVVGCGSVGGRIAVLLARVGVGGLLLVDPKNYKPGSLATHEIGPEDVGQPKVWVVGRRCKGLNAAMRVLVFAGPIEALELEALADVGLVIMAPDLLSVEVELAQRCMILGKPLVHASVHGATLTAQVRFFQNAAGQGPCPACLYSKVEWEHLSRQARFSCEGATEPTAPFPGEAPATRSLGALCSLAADLAVTQVLRHLLKLGQPVADSMLEYCGFTHCAVVSPLARNQGCRLDHTTFAQAHVDVALAGLSLAQVTQRVMGMPCPPEAQFALAGMDWLEFGACACAQAAPVRQFVSRGRTELSRCPRCAARIVPLSFYSHRLVSASVLGSATEVPLRRLGARNVSSVLLRVGDAGALVRQKPPTGPMP